MPVQFTESITGYVGASGISGDSSVILAGEMFAQSTFTPSNTLWSRNDDFSFIGNVPTYQSTRTGYGDLLQITSDLLILPVLNKYYRLEWKLQNTTASDLICQVVFLGATDSFYEEIPIVNGVVNINFLYTLDEPLVYINFGVSSPGGLTDGTFEVVYVSLKEIKHIGYSGHSGYSGNNPGSSGISGYSGFSGEINQTLFPYGDIGGSGSAGPGNQYVSLSISGIVYKLLHDGVINQS
jgi:hypothetical protein